MQKRGAPSVARNAAANWLAFLYVALVNFFLSPFIVNSLGQEGYGLWSLLVSIVGSFGLLDFGVRGAVTRFIAHHHAAGRNDDSSRVASAGVQLFGMLGGVAVLLSMVAALYCHELFNIPTTDVSEARIVMLIGGGTVAVTLVSSVFGGIVTGLERFDVNCGSEIFVTTGRTIAVVIALHEGLGLVALAWIHFACAWITGGISWYAYRRLYPELRMAFRRQCWEVVPTLLTFSVFSSLISVFGLIIYYVDSWVIAAFLPIGTVGIFAIAGNLCDYARQVGGALSKIMTPRVSALSSINSRDVSAEVVAVARLATLATGAIAITFLLRGEEFIGLWMGQAYASPSGELLRILALPVWLGGARQVAISAMIGANLHKKLVPYLGLEALANICMSIVLVKQIGVVGVALGTLIPSVIVSLVFIPSLVAKSVAVKPWRFRLDAWLWPSAACGPFGLAIGGVGHWWPAANLFFFFAQIVAMLPLIPLAAYLFCLSDAERERIDGFLRERFLRRSR